MALLFTYIILIYFFACLVYFWVGVHLPCGLLFYILFRTGFYSQIFPILYYALNFLVLRLFSLREKLLNCYSGTLHGPVHSHTLPGNPGYCVRKLITYSSQWEITETHHIDISYIKSTFASKIDDTFSFSRNNFSSGKVEQTRITTSFIWIMFGMCTSSKPHFQPHSVNIF